MNIPENKGKMVVFSVQTPDQSDEEVALNLTELSELLKTAGYSTVATMVQKRQRVDRTSYFGEGKVKELRKIAEESEADGIVCDDELSALQIRHLEEDTDFTVSDRTGVILEIFAAVASSKEGKLQVDLARMQYQLLRLAGGYSALSRQRGGIGLKGPGETKIESDRRKLKFRISRLKKELEKVVESRALLRQKRIENLAPLFALAGYTNAGKSTLLNSLSGSKVAVNDGLFTTLDPTARKITLPSGRFCVLSDTVGFIKKLPHNLVKAFRATLEDVINAQVLIIVTDISAHDAEERISVVRDILSQIDALQKEIIMIFNKTDKVTSDVIESFRNKYPEALFISAHHKTDLDTVYKLFDKFMQKEYKLLEMLIPKDSQAVKQVFAFGLIKAQEWRDDNIYLKAEIPVKMFSLIEKYII
ncbi:MAG: GTPase HflX [Candidatus Riflebacteria bacterium]|nr:GTPase HflX [Candidatus Riflebacteria bacterium]